MAVLSYVGWWGFLIGLVGGVIISVRALIDGLVPSTAFVYMLLTFTAIITLMAFIVWAWHKFSPTTLRNKALDIGELYAEGFELRNHVASLRILDHKTETKMNELQLKLVEQMRDLAPIQAIRLQTLNKYKPSDHPPMVLQDPKRTLEFSEFLSRVEKILENYK